MIRKLTLALMLSGSVLAAQAPAFAQTAAPVSKLVEAVNIPHEKFTLDNGLTVLVHEDRKAPIVAVSIWYGVGSKHEPKGKTGYAHLFEHIMFNGSENAPGDYFEYTKKIGATDLGYRLAKQFGLNVVPPRPALVPLTFNPADWQPFAALAGLSLPVDISTGVGKQCTVFEEDLLFTHRGLSGPAVVGGGM